MQRVEHPLLARAVVHLQLHQALHHQVQAEVAGARGHDDVARGVPRPAPIAQALAHLQAVHAAAAVEQAPQLLLVLAPEADGALVPQVPPDRVAVEDDDGGGPGQAVHGYRICGWGVGREKGGS